MVYQVNQNVLSFVDALYTDVLNICRLSAAVLHVLELDVGSLYTVLFVLFVIKVIYTQDSHCPCGRELVYSDKSPLGVWNRTCIPPGRRLRDATPFSTFVWGTTSLLCSGHPRSLTPSSDRTRSLPPSQTGNITQDSDGPVTLIRCHILNTCKEKGYS